MRSSNPLVIQADLSILADVHAPLFEEARRKLARFAELEKSPEHMHTYRLTPLSLWNAAATGLSAGEAVLTLEEYARYPVPSNVLTELRELLGRYGKLTMTVGESGDLELRIDDPSLVPLARGHKSLSALLRPGASSERFLVSAEARGEVKQSFLKLGFPVDDRAGYAPGRPLSVSLLGETRGGLPFSMRPYQLDAVSAFVGGGAGGHGVVVLPCGAGKTVVGMGVMAEVASETLILTTSVTAARQWIAELLDKTSIDEQAIGEYSGKTKQVRPVTVATYQILTRRSAGRFLHFEKLCAHEFGLIIYDEVHLVPAPVFRLTAEIQTRRRLGLTATLVREDSREGDVFSLIGPKRYDAPWKQIESQGFIASASCYELRIPLSAEEQLHYQTAEPSAQHRLASTGKRKLAEARRLCEAHGELPVLIIGVYLDQLGEAARFLDAELITGQTPQRARENILDRFRRGEIKRLVLSRVGNFSIDLPEASVCIQISGSFGSRQEEAQRLGRVLRPKKDGGEAFFYSLVSADTVEQRFAMNRQMFLTEQGYRYYIEEVAPLVAASDEREVSSEGATILPFPAGGRRG